MFLKIQNDICPHPLYNDFSIDKYFKEYLAKYYQQALSSPFHLKIPDMPLSEGPVHGQ